ncbi:GNAT family N-acetyltransferase [Candidatus Clostridium radicumherbarum]|uniref:GNAT family N-acetyltransferase n=1 Tax=Candidatus Clostridium radicumherbarum TaxID=3381662 RepID=A0ABW8TX21_9CLOT
MIKIETSRLLIRDHIKEDLLPLHSLLSNEEAMYYIPDLKTENIEESRENLDLAMNEAKLKDRNKYFFAIINKETNEYVGDIGFTVIIDSLYGKVVNMGYFSLPKFWGKGLITEAAEAVIDFAFNNAWVLKIETGCIKANKGSERVMQKVGMLKEADMKLHVLLDNKLFDRVEYRILKEEWTKFKGKSEN